MSLHRDTAGGLMRQGSLLAGRPCRQVRTTTPTADLECGVLAVLWHILAGGVAVAGSWGRVVVVKSLEVV